MPVLIQNRQKKLPYPPELTKLLKRAVKVVLRAEGLPPETDISIVLVNDDQIRTFNAQYRGIDSPTDVLSFPQFAPGEGYKTEMGEYLLGDIMINLERAALQAVEYGHNLTREVVYLAVHGLYHLLGYGHSLPAQKKVMRAREKRILADLGLGEEM